MCLQSRYTAAYDTHLLEVMSELLVSYFSAYKSNCTDDVYEEYAL